MTDQGPGGAPDLEEILDWLEERLPDDRRADLERRLAQAGPQTAELVTWARAFLADSTALPCAVRAAPAGAPGARPAGAGQPGRG
jgi:hypothetical protein